MAKLTAAQIEEIKRQARKNIQTRAALQARKVSNVEAGAIAEKMSKGVSSRARSIDANFKGAMSPSARASDAAQQKKNADLEKQRRFAKGEKPLATKARVGTKTEYKALGKEIGMKAELHKKAAEIAKKKPAVTASTAAAPKKDLMPYKATKPVEKTTMPNKDTKTVGKQNISAKSSGPKKIVETPKTRVGSGVAFQGELSTAKEVNRYKAAVAAGKSKGEAYRIAKAGSTGAKVTTGTASAGAKASNIGAKVADAGAKAATGAASSAAKKAGFGKILGAVAKGARAPFTPTGIAATVGIEAATRLFKNLNENAKTGKTVSNKTAGKGSTTGFVAENKNPIQKGTFKGPLKPVLATPATGATGGKYRVSSGDTLSGIAARAGVSLAELRAANPQLDGKGIFRNTGVNIPKKGKMPTGGYTGPVPYKAPKK